MDIFFSRPLLVCQTVVQSALSSILISKYPVRLFDADSWSGLRLPLHSARLRKLPFNFCLSSVQFAELLAMRGNVGFYKVVAYWFATFQNTKINTVVNGSRFSWRLMWPVRTARHHHAVVCSALWCTLTTLLAMWSRCGSDYSQRTVLSCCCMWRSGDDNQAP